MFRINLKVKIVEMLSVKYLLNKIFIQLIQFTHQKKAIRKIEVIILNKLLIKVVSLSAMQPVK